MPSLIERRGAIELPELRTVAEVAECLRLSRATIYNLMDAGELPFVKIGKSRRIRWVDVEKMIEQNTHGGAA